jgi:hypothetical protein
MNQIFDVAARLRAYGRREAVVVRTTSLLVPDAAPVFGVAPIRMASEQRVQAIAFGNLGAGAPPRVVVELNPLGRTSTGLHRRRPGRH